MREIVVFLMICVVLLAVLFMAGCCPQKALEPLSPPGKPITPEMKATIEGVKSTHWLISLAIIGVAISVAGAVIYKSPIFGGVAAGCLTMLGLVLMATRFATWIAIVSFGMSICLFIYYALIRNNALKQVIENVEVIKANVPIAIREDMTHILSLQSPTTKAIVAKERKGFIIGETNETILSDVPVGLSLVSGGPQQNPSSGNTGASGPVGL